MPLPDKPAHFLPAVGRHTDVLERESDKGKEKESTNKVSVRRPSVAEVPEMKKPKLEDIPSEGRDAHMSDFPEATFGGGVSPGRAISGTQEDSLEVSDVEIPALGQASSPSFASQAVDIPNFPGLCTAEGGPQLIDLTEQDAKLDAQETDELAKAVPDSGAGLMRHLNSELNTASQHNSEFNSNPLLYNAAARAKMSEVDKPTNYMQAPPPEMPAWLQEIHQGLQSLHIKADRQYSEIHTGLQSQDVRISHVEAVTAEHSDQHKLTAAKLRSIEDKIKELEALKDAAPRSPRHYPGTGAPRSPVLPDLLGIVISVTNRMMMHLIWI